MDKDVSRSAELTVVCVLWQGEKPFKGRSYGPMHVARLQKQVQGHLSIPHDFVVSFGTGNWPGWWHKCTLFAPEAFEGRVLYLDLDVTIIADLNPLVEMPADFAIIKDWSRRGFNSSVMVWNAGVGEKIYTDITPSDMQRLHGDQDWITECMRGDATCFPLDWCVSYKQLAARQRRVPDAAKIVVYHGFPKPWDLPADHLDALGKTHV